MQKITRENIQDYALKLMFKMKEEEFPSFEKEFETILKHMDLIGQIDGIEKVEPMTFPFRNPDVILRKDVATYGQIRVHDSSLWRFPKPKNKDHQSIL